MSSFTFIESDTESLTIPSYAFSHAAYYANDVISLFFRIKKEGGEGSVEVRLNTLADKEADAIRDITARATNRTGTAEMIYQDTGIVEYVRNYRGLTAVTVNSFYDSPYINGIQDIITTDPTPATVAAGVPLEGKPGQIIVKDSTTDYDTSWRFLSATVTGDQLVAALEVIEAGDPVYVDSADSSYIYVKIADADDAAKMPCVGIAYADAAYGATIDVTTHGLWDGEIFGYTGLSVGDVVYVGESGGLTTTRPTASTAVVQPMGVITKVNSAGTTIEQILVTTSGHEHLVPNLADGVVFMGGVTDQLSPYSFPLSDGSANQVLQTDGAGNLSFSTVTTSGGGGTIDSNLSVTNSIGDAVSGLTYSSGTDIEDILRDILAPFTEPTIVSLTVTGTGTAGEDYLSSGNDIIFPANTTSTIDSIVLQVTDYANLEDGVTIVNTSADPDENIVNNASYTFSGNSSTFSSLSYSPTNQSSGVNVTVVTTLSYLGNNGVGSAVSLTLNSFIRFRDPWYVYAYSATNPSISTLTSSGTKVIEELTMDPGNTLQELDFDCTSDTVNTSNYTFLVIPSIFAIDEVAASVSGRGVADYTDSFTLLGSSYSYNSSTYKIYRSNQTGAFDSDVTLHLTISKP